MPDTYEDKYKPKTKFGEVAQNAFEPENFANIVLPILGVVESLATKGQSPGTGAMGIQQSMNQGINDARKRKLDEQSAKEREKQMAWAEEDRKTAAMERALKKQFQDAVGAIDVNDPERRDKLMTAYKAYDPTGYSKFELGSKGSVKLHDTPIEELYSLIKQYPDLDFSSSPGFDLDAFNYKLGRQTDEAIKKQASVKPANIKLAQKDTDAMAAVYEAGTKLIDFVDGYKNGSWGSNSALGTMALGAKSAASKVPLVGGLLSPELKAFNNKRRQIAETSLRAATGAAAPAHEVKTYMGFLPEAWDVPEVSQGKMDDFIMRIVSTASGRTKALESEGNALIKAGAVELGQAKIAMARSLQNDLLTTFGSMPRIVDKQPEQKIVQQLSPSQSIMQGTSLGATNDQVDSDYEALLNKYGVK